MSAEHDAAQPMSDAVISLLRNTHYHHVQLSAVADLKANILITASSILISVSIGFGASTDSLRPSIAVLSVGMIVSLALAVISVLPKYAPTGRVAGADHPQFNVLFFGHFSRVSPDEFVDRLRRVSADDASVFEAQALDIYELGAYLERFKYRFLRYAYATFLTALIIAAIVEFTVG